MACVQWSLCGHMSHLTCGRCHSSYSSFSSSAGLLVCVLSQGVLGAMRLTVSATQLGLFADSRLAWPHVTLCCDSKSSVTVCGYGLAEQSDRTPLETQSWSYSVLLFSTEWRIFAHFCIAFFGYFPRRLFAKGHTNRCPRPDASWVTAVCCGWLRACGGRGADLRSACNAKAGMQP